MHKYRKHYINNNFNEILDSMNWGIKESRHFSPCFQSAWTKLKHIFQIHFSFCIFHFNGKSGSNVQLFTLGLMQPAQIYHSSSLISQPRPKLHGLDMICRSDRINSSLVDPVFLSFFFLFFFVRGLVGQMIDQCKIIVKKRTKILRESSTP